MSKIEINRAPVLTLWGAVVAERLGYGRDTALTLGHVVAGKTAFSKGQPLGLVRRREPAEAKTPRAGPVTLLEFMGRHMTMIETAKGLLAMQDGLPVSPATVEEYLAGKFGTDLGSARDAMEKLARLYLPAQLARSAFSLYRQFRPSIPSGAKGWGKDGVLDLDVIARMTEAKGTRATR